MNSVLHGQPRGQELSAEVAGAEYVAAMERDPTDREYRRAFLDLAVSLAPTGGRIFDFGCGPGSDARHYAAAGLQVGAYDVSPSMCEYFSRQCAEEIAAGTVQLNAGEYSGFLRSVPAGGEAVDLIVANFAPLNLVPELAPIFAKFASMLNTEGRLLASILNPFYRPLLGMKGWWARLPLLFSSGHYVIRPPGQQPVARWLPGRMATRASPWFELEAIFAPRIGLAGGKPWRLSRSAFADWKHVTPTQFLFMQFKRLR